MEYASPNETSDSKNISQVNKYLESLMDNFKEQFPSLKNDITYNLFHVATVAFLKENNEGLTTVRVNDEFRDELLSFVAETIQEKDYNPIVQLVHQMRNHNNNDVDINSLSQADFIAKNLAKSLSIKSGVILKIEEQKVLVDDLFACKENLLCPFNRKIFITFDQKEIQKKIESFREERELLIEEKNRLENDLKYIEKLAREKYKMAKPGEKVFKVIDKDGDNNK